MSIFKRGRVYWYHFIFNGQHVQKSTKQGNPNVARQIEAAYRTALAKGDVGIVHRKRMSLAKFIEDRFRPWCKASFEHSFTRTWNAWYRPSLGAILDYKDLSERDLNEITSEHVAAFAARLKSKGLKTSSVNSRLRVLRRVFHLAVEWSVLDVAPKIKLLYGEQHREHVLTPQEEAKYLSTASPLLSDVATVLVDTGMRPDECFRLLWENVTWTNARHGTLMVTHGKTAAARRVLPMTKRVAAILETRWSELKKPSEGWVWPAPTRSGHIEPSTLKKQHKAALRASGVRPFVLYSLRHTFLTRLGESGCDVWTLARIAGHSSITISSRYVHPSHKAVISAMERMPSLSD